MILVIIRRNGERAMDPNNFYEMEHESMNELRNHPRGKPMTFLIYRASDPAQKPCAEAQPAGADVLGKALWKITLRTLDDLMDLGDVIVYPHCLLSDDFEQTIVIYDDYVQKARSER